MPAINEIIVTSDDNESIKAEREKINFSDGFKAATVSTVILNELIENRRASYQKVRGTLLTNVLRVRETPGHPVCSMSSNELEEWKRTLMLWWRQIWRWVNNGHQEPLPAIGV